MKLGSLFSGGGLGDFGFMAAGFDIRWQVEIDEYCQKILALRYPESEKYRDIKTLRGSDLEPVDIITGGFPCQPFSVAGRQKGKDDNRYLWPEMLRVIDEVRPRWVVGENVPGIINLALDTVCADLESKGYEVWPIVFPSHALGAWHKRDRLWIVGYAEHSRQYATKESRSITQGNDSGKTGTKQASEPTGPSEQYETVGIPTRKGRELWAKREQVLLPQLRERLLRSYGDGIYGRYWDAEPKVDRVVNGCPDILHRLKMLGNGQVPACTYVIGEFINEVERTINQGG